jgi:hypothetical protein
MLLNPDCRTFAPAALFRSVVGIVVVVQATG